MDATSFEEEGPVKCVLFTSDMDDLYTRVLHSYQMYVVDVKIDICHCLLLYHQQLHCGKPCSHCTWTNGTDFRLTAIERIMRIQTYKELFLFLLIFFFFSLFTL